MVKSRNDHLELAALASAAQFWWLQNRVVEITEAAARMASVDGAAEHHLALEESAVRATLDPDRWPEAIARLRLALARYGTGAPTWASGQVAVFLVLLGGLDEADVAPIATRLGSPVFAATVAFYGAVPYYLRDEDTVGAELVGEAVALARAAGATFQLAGALMGQGGWRARVPRFADAQVYGPLSESLDLWERLRIPWGRIGILEEIAQARAIRGHPADAFVLWGAVDASGVQAPSKIGRHRRTSSYLSDIPSQQSDAWRAQGAAMTLDQAVVHARWVLDVALG
jgi:hypothetical protein